MTIFTFSCTHKSSKEWFQMRGVVLSVDDLRTLDWPRLAAENGINTIGTHIFPDQVVEFVRSDEGKRFLQECERYGINIEHQLHAISALLPRELFDEDSTMFRMQDGQWVRDFNLCVSSPKALDIVAANALYYSQLLPASNHRYYYWMDDGPPMCACTECSQYSDSEQALIVENRILQELRTLDPQAQVAHLAYHNTLSAPIKVKPRDGVFLEFAPFYRDWQSPLSDEAAEGRGMTHGENLLHLEENLKVFPAETAVVLEYWLDVSLFSGWKKPAIQLPWNHSVFASDLDTYRNLGIRNVTSFAVYIDSAYVAAYPDLSFLKEYGEAFSRRVSE